VLNLVQRLAEQGVAVILISHNLADVFAVADDIAVLYLGQMVAQIETKDTNRDDVVGYITGTKTMGVELIGTTNIPTEGGAA
jgi:D-xylose transport system ATP-binding protein